MGSFSLAHWIVVGIVALVLFGRGKISETMGDFGKGIKAFRQGLTEEEPRPHFPKDETLRQVTPPDSHNGS